MSAVRLEILLDGKIAQLSDFTPEGLMNVIERAEQLVDQCQEIIELMENQSDEPLDPGPRYDEIQLRCPSCDSENIDWDELSNDQEQHSYCRTCLHTWWEPKHHYINYYECQDCEDPDHPQKLMRWEDTWDCRCNDRCPGCNAEHEPYKSVLIDEDGTELKTYED